MKSQPVPDAPRFAPTRQDNSNGNGNGNGNGKRQDGQDWQD